MIRPGEIPTCPYCGLKALSLKEAGRNENVVYRDDKPFQRIRVRQCDLGHIWWEFLYFAPDLDAKAS